MTGRVKSCFKAPRSLAAARGQRAGAMPNGLPDECPYSTHDLELRSTWMEGFNTGRGDRAGPLDDPGMQAEEVGQPVLP